MLTGRQFRLNRDSLVIAKSDHCAVTIPAGQIVCVISRPRPDDQWWISHGKTTSSLCSPKISNGAARRSSRAQGR
jgi:hypothetical protein